MKVFIQLELALPAAIAPWPEKAIQSVFNGAEPWLSAEDIQARATVHRAHGNVSAKPASLSSASPEATCAPLVMFSARPAPSPAHFGELKVARCCSKATRRPGPTRWPALMPPPSTVTACACWSINTPASASPSPKRPCAAWRRVAGAQRRHSTAIATEKGLRRGVFVPGCRWPRSPSDAQYKAFRANAMKVVRRCAPNSRLTVFCALENIKSIKAVRPVRQQRPRRHRETAAERQLRDALPRAAVTQRLFRGRHTPWP